MAQRRILARNREMRSPTQTDSGSRGSQSQGALNLERKYCNMQNSRGRSILGSDGMRQSDCSLRTLLGLSECSLTMRALLKS